MLEVPLPADLQMEHKHMRKLSIVSPGHMVTLEPKDTHRLSHQMDKTNTATPPSPGKGVENTADGRLK